MNLLAIDTSTDFCSVAASRGEALFSRHERAGRRQAETILGMVDEVLAEAGIELAQIHGIAYGEGPGSFTGLRIAAGVTQGLALARGIGVIGVGSLLALSEEAGKDGAGRVIACLDAHMGEVYHAAYRRAGAGWEEVSAPGLYRPEYRLTVDEPEDVRLMQEIFSRLAASGRRVTTREAIALLDREPALARINAHLRHKAANLRSVALDAGLGKIV